MVSACRKNLFVLRHYLFVFFKKELSRVREAAVSHRFDEPEILFNRQVPAYFIS